MQRISSRAQTLFADSPPTVATIEWIDPLMAGGNWMPTLVDLAGGRSLFGQAGAHSPTLAFEALAAADPDVILIMPCGFDLARSRRVLPALTHQPGWGALSAVRRGAVSLGDGNQFFNRPGPRIVESAEILAELLYPDVDFGHWGTGWRLLEAEVPHAT
jgi:iron complex transport system substrate-binding protein